MMNKDKNNENGSVIILILIGIVLFAALIYTFTQGSRTGTSNLSSQQAKILASELLEYARQVENGVSRVRSRGCSEVELSFDQALISGYSNASAPGDNSCHIFEQAGGRVTFDNQPSSLAVSDSEIYHFSGTNIIEDIETTAPEIIVFVNNIDTDICNEVNRSLNISDSIADIPTDTEIEDAVKYQGGFASTRTIGDEDAALEAQTTACFQDTTNGNYTFYHVLLAR